MRIGFERIKLLFQNVSKHFITFGSERFYTAQTSAKDIKLYHTVSKQLSLYYPSLTLWIEYIRSTLSKLIFISDGFNHLYQKSFLFWLFTAGEHLIIAIIYPEIYNMAFACFSGSIPMHSINYLITYG